MDKDKLFDKIENELNHYCRFTCDKKEFIERVEIEGDVNCDECESIIRVDQFENVEIYLCEHCQLKSFVEVLEREII